LTESTASQKANVVQLAGPALSDREIVAGLLDRDERAAAALFNRYGDQINRLVWRLLGADDEHHDVVHQVFVNILGSIHKLKDPLAIENWLTGITVNTVRREIRSRKYRRILVPTGSDYPEHISDGTESDQQILVRRVFAILNKMRSEDHIVFGLRFIEGNTIDEVAIAGGYSLATAKRRIARAKKEFRKRAQKDSFLAPVFGGK